jgi:epoxyqueuosine reductase
VTITPAQPDVHVLAAEIKAQARGLGFDLVGIAPAKSSEYRDYLRQWLDSGQAGAMGYLANRFEERTDPTVYMPGARSVICVAVNYKPKLEDVAAGEEGHHGKVARYALGDDYHDVIKGRLHTLSDWMRKRVPDAQTKCAVDTAPVMEKELAARAGIGWLGKNTCIINERMGSWFLLGEILTTLELPHDQPGVDRCGTCRRCIDACPTGAITDAYQLDARKCISYLTIEHREEIPAELAGRMGEWVYGCDICQEVCPWNSKAIDSLDPAFAPRFATGWGQEEYRASLRKSAMKRVKLPVLQRNARQVLENRKPGE